MELKSITPAANEPDAASLLEQWLMLSEAERKLFAAMVTEVTMVQGIVAESTQSLSKRFSEIVATTRDQKAMIDKLLGRAQEIASSTSDASLERLIETMDNTLSGTIGRVIEISKESLQIVFSLEEVVEAAKQATNLMTEIEAINRQTNLLALNAKIESSRAGDAGRGFGVVADEVRELSHSINSSAEHISSKIAEVAGGLNDVFSSLQEISQIDMAESLEAKRRIDAGMETLRKDNAEFEEMLSRSLATNESIAQDISAMVQEFQFEDRVNQYLEGMSEMLNHISDQCGELTTQSANTLGDSGYKDGGEELAREIINSCRLRELRERYLEVTSLKGDEDTDSAEGAEQAEITVLPVESSSEKQSPPKDGDDLDVDLF